MDIDSPLYRVHKFLAAREVLSPAAPDVIATVGPFQLLASDVLAVAQSAPIAQIFEGHTQFPSQEKP